MMIAFSKTAEEWGWLGNMSAHPLRWEGRVWRTAEALFQALRFADEAVREAIRAKASPMAAKFVAKAHKEQMVVEPCSPQDVENMRRVLRLKLAGNAVIVEDCSRRRASPWGARLVDGRWEGQNLLGLLWAELREELRREAGLSIAGAQA
jgi:predicted NAD-dependent protein-ADP-ribosyltransferase YbiA (DUF1768 family)